jgi:hypothetical protein
MLTDKWKQAIEKVGKIPEKFVEVNWRMRNKEFDCRKMIYVYRERKIDLNTFWKNNLNLFWSLVKTKQYKNTNASAWMHQQVTKPYDKFQFSEKYYFPMFSWAQKFKINSFYLYFQRSKF